MQFQANDKQNQQTTKPTGHWVATFGFEIKEGRKQTTNKDPATKYHTSCVTFEVCSFLVCWLFVCWLPGPRHTGTVAASPKRQLDIYIYIKTSINIHTSNGPTCKNQYFQHGF